MHIRWRRYAAAALLGGCIAIMVLDFGAMYVMRQAGILFRPWQVEDLGSVGSNIVPLTDASAITDPYPANDPLGVMVQLADSVTCSTADGVPDPEDAVALQDEVEAGKPILCAGIADLYAAVLAAKGFEVRRVELMRSVMADTDTHSVVEVRENGEWVLYDPTFSVTYEVDGRRLGAQEVKERFLNGGIEEVEAVTHSTPASGASIDEYYMRWEPLFDNVIVWAKPIDNPAYKLPVLRWLYGRRAYYQIAPGHTGGQMHSVEDLNEATTWWAPIIAFGMFVGAVVLAVPWTQLFRGDRNR